jgi:MFS family permease
MATSVPGGLTFGEALRDRRLQRITLAIFLQSIMSTAMAVLVVPVLVSLGIGKAEAAGMAGIVGIGAFAGKLLAGALVDRFQSPLLPFSAFALPALGYSTILLGRDMAVLVSTGLFCIALGGGATLQMSNYLVSRYAGVRHFGKIFGVVSSIMSLATGIGPLVGGMIFDFTGTYIALMVAAIPMALVAGTAVFGLGPYPVYEPEPAP